jgi:hypothetical protein
VNRQNEIEQQLFEIPVREVEVLLPVVGGYVVTSGADVIADSVAD